MNYKLTIRSKNELFPRLQRIIDYSNIGNTQLSIRDLAGWLNCELMPIGVTSGMRYNIDYEHHHITIYGVLGDVVGTVSEAKEFEEVLPTKQNLPI